MTENETALVSGYEFHRLAKWSVCPRYPVRYNAQLINHNDILFLNLDYFQNFINIINNQPPKNKFILLTHNSDKTFTETEFHSIRNYVTHIFAINCIIHHPMITTIPLGFVDNKYKPHIIFSIVADKQYEKNILLYMNFSINTNPVKRNECYETFANVSYVYSASNLPPELFYEQIAKSKFVLSPEGTGIDCHRIYESIYLNSIPILKTSVMDSFYEKLPVLIVKSWSDINESFLLDNYDTYRKKLDDWKSKHPSWTQAPFWIR